MTKHTLLFIAVALITTSACRMNVLRGEGNKVTVTNSVASFDNISTSIPVTVQVTVQGSAPQSVQVSGYENIVKHIMTSVENGKLRIYTDLNKTWKWEDNDGVTVTISMPLLTALDMSGAADAKIHGKLAGKQFKMTLSGASDVAIDSITVDNFSATVTGAGDIKVKGGNVQTAYYNITGAGSVKAFNMKTQETTTDITGAGDGEVMAEKKLTAHISGAGSVKYKGHPDVNQHITGAGEITNANTDKAY